MTQLTKHLAETAQEDDNEMDCNENTWNEKAKMFIFPGLRREAWHRETLEMPRREKLKTPFFSDQRCKLWKGRKMHENASVKHFLCGLVCAAKKNTFSDEACWAGHFLFSFKMFFVVLDCSWIDLGWFMVLTLVNLVNSSQNAWIVDNWSNRHDQLVESNGPLLPKK